MHRAAPFVTVLLLASHASAQVSGSRSPTEGEPASALYEHATRLDAATDYRSAAEAYERYADHCLRSRTALLEAGTACAPFGDALARAFELRRALGDTGRANEDATSFAESFLYAQPREAIRIGYEAVLMFVEAGQAERAEDALARFEALHPDPPPGLGILADAARARVASLHARPERAARYWRRVELRWERDHEILGDDGPVPLEWIRDAVAEGRLIRGEALVERYLAVRPPRARRSDDTRWWARVMSPWLVRSRRRLLLARMELERVYELGSPQHSVIAAARIGEMYGHQNELHAALALPSSDWLRMLVNDGDDRPGYEEAVSHLETCVSWAHHHGVARDWARRCEAQLHTLDPYRYPIASELHGQAGYHPVSHVLPTESHRP